jgi:hypothetical protein
MNAGAHKSRIQVGLGLDGARTYLVDMAPEDLPVVRGRDVERAWYAAREAAIASVRGVTRGFRFLRRDGTTTDLALADPDASCWAAAVDHTVGLGTCYGLSLCLRLLALVELLARSPWAGGFYRLARDGAELDPNLLRAAAMTPLTAEARFDEGDFRSRLSPLAIGAPPAQAEIPGALS